MAIGNVENIDHAIRQLTLLERISGNSANILKSVKTDAEKNQRLIDEGKVLIEDIDVEKVKKGATSDVNVGDIQDIFTEAKRIWLAIDPESPLE